MPDWSLSLAVLILGLSGLVLGRVIVQGALIAPSVYPLAPGESCRGRTWLTACVIMLPALAVTLQAVWSGARNLGLGVILGVHVLGLLLAIAARRPVVCCAQAEGVAAVRRARLRAWSLIGATVGIWGLAIDGGLGHADGGVLVLLCLLYLAGMTWTARASVAPRDREPQALAVGAGRLAWLARFGRRIARVGVGLLLVTMGARVLAMGALDMALVLNLDHWTLGLTLVALASVLAGWIPVLNAGLRSGRLVSRPSSSAWLDGSLVNLLGLLGLAALTTPEGLPFTRDMLWVSWPVAILMATLAGASLIRAEHA